MKLKSKIVAICTLIMMLVLSACSSNQSTSGKATDSESGKSDGKKVIGVALSNFSDEFRTYMIDAMKKEQAKYPDYKFVYSDAQNDSAKQMNQIENFIEMKASAIIFTPVDTVAAVDIVSQANQAKIPIIVANQTFDGVDKATAYVGSKSIESGLIEMEESAKQLNGKGNIAIMDGELGHEAQIKRTEGNKQIISKYPDMKVVLEGSAKWSRPDAMKLMEDWIQSGKKIDAVIANNDEMAIGAILALDAAGKTKDVFVAGVDATPAALDLVKAGKLKVTVFQDAVGQGTASIDTAVKAANGEKVENVIVPYQLVTAKNVDEFIAKYKK